MEANDVQELVEFVEGELTNEDLLELEQQQHSEEDEEQKKFTVKGLGGVFSKINEVMLELEAMDPNVERLTKVERHINEGLRCYHEIYEEKKKQTKQKLILGFLRKTPTPTPTETTSTASTLSPATSPTPGPSAMHKSFDDNPDDP